MKNILTLFYFLTIAAFANSCAFGQAQLNPHKWTATIKVIGEDNSPIVGANVTVSYNLPPTRAQEENYGEIKELTDTNGISVISDSDTSWGLGIRVEKSGYYSTQTGYQFYFDEKRRNPTFTLVLRKIGNPISMYAKHEETKVQQVDEPMGFDLMAGDWVTPYGKGFHPDLFFTVHRKITSVNEYDCTLTVTFPNNGDGIQIAPSESVDGSAFRTSRTAAVADYRPELVLHFSNTNNPESVFGYFIRVRTELNPDGSIKSALYGKIPSGFRFYAGTQVPKAGMGFDYYLNPIPNDRNLEFDARKNLVKDIGEFEGIKQP